MMTSFNVKGNIKDYNGEQLLIQIIDDDNWYEGGVNDLLASTYVKNDGTFEVSFTDDLSKEFFEGKPDIFLVIRNSTGRIVYRTKVQREVSKNDTAKLTFTDLPTRFSVSASGDPYTTNMQRSFTGFQRISDTVNPTENTQRTVNLLLQTMQAWTIYTNDSIWEKIGYDGPQVERYPWKKLPHSHKLGWENE